MPAHTLKGGLLWRHKASPGCTDSMTGSARLSPLEYGVWWKLIVPSRL